MKKFTIQLWCIFMFSCLANAQTPQYIPYQAVARNAVGNLLVNQAVSLRFTIRESSGSGTIDYQETQSATTNNLGLFSVNIGNGTVVSGTFSSIPWGNGNAKYTEVEIDPTGGTNYVSMGAAQMMSVPYALYAGTATSAAGTLTNGSGLTGGTYNGSAPETWAVQSLNGLNTNSTDNAVELGGTLNKATTISQAGNALSIGTDAANNTLTLGSTNGTSTANINSGSGAVNVNANNNQPTNINTGTSSGTITLGGNSSSAVSVINSSVSGTSTYVSNLGSTPTGSVGIGTTSPGSSSNTSGTGLLDVNGSVLANDIWMKVGEQNVTSGTHNITFTNLNSQKDKMYKLVVQGQMAIGSGSDVFLVMIFNGDSASGHYQYYNYSFGYQSGSTLPGNNQSGGADNWGGSNFIEILRTNYGGGGSCSWNTCDFTAEITIGAYNNNYADSHSNTAKQLTFATGTQRGYNTQNSCTGQDALSLYNAAGEWDAPATITSITLGVSTGGNSFHSNGYFTGMKAMLFALR